MLEISEVEKELNLIDDPTPSYAQLQTKLLLEILREVRNPKIVNVSGGLYGETDLKEALNNIQKSGAPHAYNLDTN